VRCVRKGAAIAGAGECDICRCWSAICMNKGGICERRGVGASESSGWLVGGLEAVEEVGRGGAGCKS